MSLKQLFWLLYYDISYTNNMGCFTSPNILLMWCFNRPYYNILQYIFGIEYERTFKRSCLIMWTICITPEEIYLWGWAILVKGMLQGWPLLKRITLLEDSTAPRNCVLSLIVDKFQGLLLANGFWQKYKVIKRTVF